jgi:hypothetical protein
MNRVKSTFPHIIWRLALALAICLPASLAVNVPEAKAGGGTIPVIGLIAGIFKRNKVYRDANSFIKEQAAYYDALRETARQQLLEREMTYGLRSNQVAAYTKVVALLEGERQSMYDFAESEKKAAHDEFIGLVQGQVTNVMLSSVPAARLLGAMSRGVNSSQGFLDSALSKLSGDSGGMMEDVNKIRRIGERIQIAGEVIGGSLGEALRKGGGKIADLLKKPQQEIEDGLIQVQSELGDLGDLIQGLQGQGYRPTASETTREVVIHLVTGEEASPTITAIADMLVAKHGGGGNLRDRARDILLGNAAARCAARVEKIRQIIFRLEVDPAAEDTSDLPPACEVVDLTALTEEVTDAEMASPTQESQPAATQADTPAAPPTAAPTATESEPEVAWVLVNTEVNPNNEKTSFVGGGADPTWFGEARFAGKSLVFSVSDGSFSVHDVDVDHEYTYRDATVSVNFTSPPGRLDSGEEVSLQASASHSGTINEGGSGIGLIFQYTYYGNALDPVFSYSPWNPAFSGQSSEQWTFTAPVVFNEGEEFQFSAGLWNAAPCLVVWTYRAEGQ